MISIDVHGLSVCLLWFMQEQREERKVLDPGRPDSFFRCYSSQVLIHTLTHASEMKAKV
jgi:hypothetical protein